MFVVESVALFARVKNTTIKIAASILPVKTRWFGSSTPESGFASLLDPGFRGANTWWLSGELLSVYCRILAQTLGWGTVNKPPGSGQRVWLADTFMYPEWEDTGDFHPTLNLECGVFGDFAKLEKFRKKSESCAELRCQSLRSQLAIIPINLHASHWVYAVFDFEILLCWICF